MTDSQKLKVAALFLALAAVVAWLLTAGCASMTTAEKTYMGGAVADIATTAYGLENCNAREGNPLLTLAGNDTAQVVASAALFKWAVYKAIQRWGNETAMVGASVPQYAVAGLNAGAVARCR